MKPSFSKMRCDATLSTNVSANNVVGVGNAAMKLRKAWVMMP